MFPILEPQCVVLNVIQYVVANEQHNHHDRVLVHSSFCFPLLS